MLLDTFFTYQLVSNDNSTISVTIDLIKEHDIYKGHFPTIPITPGVCQVQMLSEVLCKELDKNLMLRSARDIKFLNMINPQEVSKMQLDIKYTAQEDGTIQVSGLMVGENAKYLKIRAVYGER